MLLLLLTMSLSPVRCTQHNWLKSFLKEYSYIILFFWHQWYNFEVLFGQNCTNWSGYWMLDYVVCSEKWIFSHSIQIWPSFSSKIRGHSKLINKNASSKIISPHCAQSRSLSISFSHTLFKLNLPACEARAWLVLSRVLD